MNPDEKITIIWQGEEVGMLLKPVPDMWYLEGPWVSNDSSAANAFEILAKALDSKVTFADLDKGIKVFLKSEDSLLRAIVISLTSEHRLLVRRMYHSKKADSHDKSIFHEIQNLFLLIAKAFQK